MNLDQNISELPINQLSNDQFRTFFDDYMGEGGVKEQSVVRGRVIQISDDWVTIDISYKAEGLVPVNEFKNAEGELSVKVGDEVDVYLDQMGGDDGALVLSKEKADLMKAWDEISGAVERDEVVKGVVVARVKGGLSVNIGVKAFLPGSQVDLRPVKNLDKLIGESFEFKIIKFNKKRGNIVLSRRALLEQERESKRGKTMEQLAEGSILTGIVKNITDYGAFIDLGGIDGLLHITDMSWGRVNHPSEIFEVGQSLEVKILKFDHDSQRVSLGYKQIRPDPWHDAELKYPLGAIVRGKVVSIPDYGAFVELEDGIEGLVHISEMTWNKRIKHPSKLLEIGDMIEAKVLGVDVESKRISLGVKQLESNPWDLLENQCPVGSIVKGKIRNITDFGIFVGIDEGIDGLVHISDLSWSQRVRHPAERYQKGDEVEARVLAIDKDNERFSLGVKQLTEDPWYTIHGRYFLGQVVAGSVVHRAEFGVFVEVEEGIEGLVHLSELAQDGDDWQNHYEMGQKIQAEVIHIDSHDRKISLSEKGASVRGEDAENMESFIKQQGDSSARLGDVMGNLGRKLAEAAEKTEEGASAEAAEAAPVEEPEAAPVEEAEAAPVEEAEAAPAEEAEAAPAEEAEAAPAEEAEAAPAEEAEAAPAEEAAEE
jgi:small subunit ribosomal protein S1